MTQRERRNRDEQGSSPLPTSATERSAASPRHGLVLWTAPGIAVLRELETRTADDGADVVPDSEDAGART